MPSNCHSSSSPAQLTAGLMMPPPLAPELHFLIIQHVDNETDLRSLTLCCSAFRDEAQRCLFRDVAPTSLDQEKQFLSTINGTPLSLGPLVHSFHVKKWGSENTGHAKSLSTALQAMHKLKHLRLDSWDPSRVLHTGTFQLQTFVCNSYLEGPKQVCFLLCKFLPAQKDIKRLEIYYGRNPINLSDAPKDICPQLESLSINDTEITHILLADTRLISEFQWHELHAHPPLTIRQLNYLKSLVLFTHLREMDTSFMAHLTSLVDLTLFVLKTTTEHLLDTVLCLQHIPHLQFLILVLVFPRSQTEIDNFDGERSPVFQRAFELCPHLKHIDVTARDTRHSARLVRQTTTENNVSIWRQQSNQSSGVKDWRYLA